MGRHAGQAHELSTCRGRGGARRARSKADRRLSRDAVRSRTLEDSKQLCGELAKLNLDYISVSLDDYRSSRPQRETRVYSGPVPKIDTPAESPITAFARIIAGRSAVLASGGIKTCLDAEGALELGADLVAVGRAVVVDPEWLAKVRSKSEGSILAGLPKDEREIADALSIPPRMVDYLLSRPGWIPRL